MRTNDKERILAFLNELYPNVGCELIYHKDYELLIAVMLSAQTTDKSVNAVTPKLFSLFPSLEMLAEAPIEEIEKCIQSIGMYHQKARNVKGIASGLINRFQGHVPSSKEDLMSLPGVGNKTANVVRAELFQIPEIAVDTHVARISKRLYFANEDDDVGQIEKKLRQALEPALYIKLHHQMIHFGRYFCKAINPQCMRCQLSDICRYKKK